MAGRGEKLIGKDKLNCTIEIIKTDTECSTDEKVMQCCSLKGIKELIPILNRSNTTNCKNNNDVRKEFCSKHILQWNDHMNKQYMQIYHYKTDNYSIKKKPLLKNDERMYDLAHLLFKISDLSLKVTEYEKLYCVEEIDLHRMLNIVKVEIMKSFLKGRTKHETMNKIIIRLIYLDEYIKEMFENKVNTNNLKIITEHNLKSSIDRNRTLLKNRKRINYLKKAKTKNSKQASIKNSSNNEITVLPTSTNESERLNDISGFSQNNLSDSKNLLEDDSVVYDDNLTVPHNSFANGLTKTESNSIQTMGNKIRKRLIEMDDEKPIDRYVQTESDLRPNVDRFSAATSYEDIHINSNRSIPNIDANQLRQQRYSPELSPKEWKEIDEEDMEMDEMPVEKVSKQISAQKLKISKERNKEDSFENNASTENILLSEDGKYQIISMNVLYSKTHARYIIPNWMPVEYNIDETPKVLSKQDLDDGLALTSYKADRDGTIHFTLTFSSTELNNISSSDDVATKLLVEKLQDIRGLWAESARKLYDSLIKQYDEENVKVEFTNCID